MCLQVAGCSLGDVLKVGGFVTSMDDFPAYNEVYREFFSEPFPARTTVQVGLAMGMRVEIDCVAPPALVAGPRTHRIVHRSHVSPTRVRSAARLPRGGRATSLHASEDLRAGCQGFVPKASRRRERSDDRPRQAARLRPGREPRLLRARARAARVPRAARAGGGRRRPRPRGARLRLCARRAADTRPRRVPRGYGRRRRRLPRRRARSRAAPTTAVPARGRSTSPATTAPSCSTPTATTSRPSATRGPS